MEVWLWLAVSFACIVLSLSAVQYLSRPRLARWAARGALRLARFASASLSDEMDEEDRAARTFIGRIAGEPDEDARSSPPWS